MPSEYANSFVENLQLFKPQYGFTFETLLARFTALIDYNPY